MIDHYIQLLSDVQDGTPWIDETFAKKIDGISEAEAFTRPLPEIHSVAELLSHLIVWRRVITDSLRGKAYVSVFDSPKNWKTNDELKKSGWEKLKQEFYSSQKEIRSILEHENDAWLSKVYSEGSKLKYLLDGLVAHDIYHLGQIGITVKLLKSRILSETESAGSRQ